MIIRLNETLRPLRQQAGLTQGALAEQLGVSDRAVSRWERGEAYPDVTLLPRLALLLHVSVDALLGVDSKRRQTAIDEALEACNGYMQQGAPQEAVAALRAALAAYPDEPELMVYLARALMALHTDEAAREALSLCRAADGKPARLSTAYGCKQVSALALHRLGKSEQAAQLVSDELPSFWVCRELLYPRVAPPEKAEGQRQFNLLWLADHMYFTLREMAKYADDPAHTVLLMKKAVRIYREAAGDSAGMYEERIWQAYMKIARASAELGQPDEVVEALQHALDAADLFAAHDGRYAAPWLSGTHGKATEPHEARGLYAHLLAAAAEPAFEAMQGEARFGAILDRARRAEERMAGMPPDAPAD